MSALRPHREVPDRSFHQRGTDRATVRTGMLPMVASVALRAAVEAIAGTLFKRHSPVQVVGSRHAVHLAFPAVSGPMPQVGITPDFADLFQLLAVGLLGDVTLLALDLFGAAAPVAPTAPLPYLQLVFAASITFALHRERPRRSALVGAMVIAALPAYLYAQRPRPSAREFS